VKLKVQSVSWHRNGIGGVGFYAVIFTDPEQQGSEEKGNMVASLFDEPGYCAVYNLPLLEKGDVAFGSNSYRGDVYEEQLRPLVEKWLKKNGGNRIGPFSVPVI
jgi:hypothetical protein